MVLSQSLLGALTLTILVYLQLASSYMPLLAAHTLSRLGEMESDKEKDKDKEWKWLENSAIKQEFRSLFSNTHFDLHR